MKDFKGTNIDWQVFGQNDNGVFVGGDDSSGAICHVYYQNNAVAPGEGRANVRLIRSALDLLKCLQELVDLVPSVNIEHQNARSRAILAINKALGDDET